MAGVTEWAAFCRDCLSDARAGEPCPACGSTRVVAHPELEQLSIAHMDCDAFYAAIEKRDDPSLKDKPLIVGGETRGVVSTCCYLARKFGVRSAMPMFQARKLCPQAVVLKPRHAHYAQVARQIRTMMEELTPLVEPLSLDEAYLDLSGTQRIHHRTPAKTMAALAQRIAREIGITVSVGLSGNKFLAKLASELDKPRGFAVIGMAEATSFLRDKPVGMMRGAGKVMQARLERDGITTIGQLQDAEPRELAHRYGATGLWLHRMANANDSRKVEPGGEMKTISSETTFNSDLSRLSELESVLWRQAERVSARAKKLELGGRTVVLKLPVEAREALAAVLDGLPADAPCALLVPPEAVTDAALGDEGEVGESSPPEPCSVEGEANGVWGVAAVRAPSVARLRQDRGTPYPLGT